MIRASLKVRENSTFVFYLLQKLYKTSISNSKTSLKNEGGAKSWQISTQKIPKEA